MTITEPDSRVTRIRALILTFNHPSTLTCTPTDR